jgi:hypothetical protein
LDFNVASWGLMNPRMGAESAAPLIIRAMKRVWLRFTITHSTKRQHNTEKGRRIQISNARIFQPFLSPLADITQWYQGFL